MIEQIEDIKIYAYTVIISNLVVKSKLKYEFKNNYCMGCILKANSIIYFLV